jgi:hypothetical protein
MSMGLIRERTQFDFIPLSERPDTIPQVAGWWCDEWGLPQRHESMESYLSELASLKPGKLPIHLLALSERNIVGVALRKINLHQAGQTLRKEKCAVMGRGVPVFGKGESHNIAAASVGSAAIAEGIWFKGRASVILNSLGVNLNV